MSMIEPFALFTRDATIQIFPASIEPPEEAVDDREPIDLERVVWDVDYRNEVKRRLGSAPRLP